MEYWLPKTISRAFYSFCLILKTALAENNCLEVTKLKLVTVNTFCHTSLFKMNDDKEPAKSTRDIIWYQALFSDWKLLERPKDQSRGKFK